MTRRKPRQPLVSLRPFLVLTDLGDGRGFSQPEGLPSGLPPIVLYKDEKRGRPSELSDRLSRYEAAIQALSQAGYAAGQITQREVADRLAGDDEAASLADRAPGLSQLRADMRAGQGWGQFRAAALREMPGRD